MKYDVFAYGILMYEDVLLTLTGKRFSLEPATLHHHHRYGFLLEGFPELAVVLPKENASVSGVVIRDVDAQAMRVLDLFEDVDDIYGRSRRAVTLASGAELHTDVYLGTAKAKTIARGDWDEDEFIRLHYQRYIDAAIPDFLNEIKAR